MQGRIELAARCIFFVLLLAAVSSAQQNTGYQKNFDIAEQYKAQGRFLEAEWQMRAALAEAENSAALADRLPAALFELAEIYRMQGKYADAEPLLSRLLVIRENEPAPDAAGLTKTLEALAHVQRSQGKYSEAELLYRRSLDLREIPRPRQHGPASHHGEPGQNRASPA